MGKRKQSTTLWLKQLPGSQANELCNTLHGVGGKGWPEIHTGLRRREEWGNDSTAELHRIFSVPQNMFIASSV